MGKITVSAQRIPIRLGTKAAIIVLSGTLLSQSLLGGGAYVHADAPPAEYQTATRSENLHKISEEMITSGAKLVNYQYTVKRKNKTEKVKVNVIEADMKNPYLQLGVMTGKNGKTAGVNNVSKMTKETGAVAGVNGDYWDMSSEGVPMGGAVSDGVVITSPSQLQGMYAFVVTQEGQPKIDHYSFEGKVSEQGGTTFPLAGINKPKYIMEPSKQNSHVNAMYVYTSAWKGTSRPKDASTTPTEALVRGGVVEQFSDKAPLAMEVPEGAVILRGHGKAADYMRKHMQVGASVQVNYELISKTTNQAVDPSSLQMMIGGHTLLVENGAPSAFTRNTANISGSSARARTAVGYSQDGRHVYMVTAEKNEGNSGLTLKELQQVLVKIGAWKAVNLDGGGSTTMVSRPLAETDTVLAHQTEYGGTSSRSVVNGIGVYTTAPQGKVKGIAISGEKTLFIGQRTGYAVKAYDEYYNPMENTTLSVNWSSTNGAIAWNGESFVAKKPGKSQVIASSGNAKTTADVEVVGADQIAELRIGTASAPLEAGASVHMPITAKLIDGRSFKLPAEAVTWELQGFKGNVQDGTLNVSSVDANTSEGYAIASYNGWRTIVPLTTTSDQAVESFNAARYPISFSGLPAAKTVGSVELASGIGGREQKALKLAYDMSEGTEQAGEGSTADGKDNKFAYAVLNDDKGITLPTGSTSLKIDVHGDNSGNWLRMKLVDANGKEQLVDLAKEMDWEGWKTVSADLSGLGLTGPVKLSRLYVVNLAKGQADRAITGEVAFDNIAVQLPSANETNELAKNEMKLTVNSKRATVNGTSKKLDVAPIVLNSTTYVPVKYIIDAFGGKTMWDGKLKRVSILRGERFIEMIVNNKSINVNGKRLKSDVAPIVQNGRTLVPLRLVGDQLGLNVNWEQKTKTITIH
ncbi:stalk domain-containing protein [Paenibacillus sp. 481]|uniref:stalk domain-containing protein n=1 Tax=Paenibacillus sp. 481 TaxID=2835869 RepID=UPI001E5C0F65|nr:phosphodiester glycosidase family protein [Paenibacillus sp. 481]UHA75699.1 phosphodiester glycosidase family protein [Paenibacillus sp. 481]